MLVVLIGCNGVGIALTGQSSSAYTNILAGGDACGRYEMDYYGVTAKKVLKSLVDRYGEIWVRSDGRGATIVNYMCCRQNTGRRSGWYLHRRRYRLPWPRGNWYSDV